MNSITSHPIGPAQQAVPAAKVSSPQLLLTDISLVADKLGLADEPTEPTPDTEYYSHHGINE